MSRTITPEREQKKSHAITLRKQGWTEQAIAEHLIIPQRTISLWLSDNFSNNDTLGNTAKSWKVSNNNRRDISAKNLEFQSFLGTLEDFETDKRFPLIIADPPWNISVENSMQFTFLDKNGNKHTDMKRNFGSWDFMGDDQSYLQKVETWLTKLHKLASENSYCWFWCSYRYLSHINNIGKNIGWEPKGWYVWAKTNVPPLTASINGTLLPSLEPCLIFRKGKGQLRANKVGHPNYKELPMVSNGERLKDAENIAAKPIAILSDIIEWCTEPGDWVLDVFSGTGSTSRAALLKKRKTFAVESDKRQLTLLQLHIEETYGSKTIRN
jgi:DNA modification methylase